MVIDIDDATVRHAAAVTVFGLIVCAFTGSFLSHFLMFILEWIAERKVRREKLGRKQFEKKITTVSFYWPSNMPLLMNQDNFNDCAIELESVLDSLNAQFSAAKPLSSEAISLQARLKDHTEARDAFRVLARLFPESLNA